MNELDRNRKRKLEIKTTLSLSIINYQLSIIYVIPDVFDQGIKGLPFNPVVVDPLAFN